MIKEYLNQKVLVTTQNWFVAPDGKEYRSAWGTLKGVHEAGKTLGFIPNRSHANWFLEVGKMNIMGCQVLYVIQCPEKPNVDEKVKCWSNQNGDFKEYERPTLTYIAE